VAPKGTDESQRVRRVRRNGRVLIVWTGFICSGVPMAWWYVQTRSIAASSKSGPVDPPAFWSSALVCLVTTGVTWFVGCYLIREYLNGRDRTRALMADLRGAVRRQES
jgi:hypothetical protein